MIKPINLLLAYQDIGGIPLNNISDLKEFDVIDELNKTNFSIVDLLPQNNSALIRDSKMAFEILKMLHNIINLFSECLRQFYIKKDYQYFDPHVGENACQIRAYAFLLLSKKKIITTQ